YRLHGKHYARLISSLTGKRVKTDPCFRNTMRNATMFGKASKIASTIYRLIPIAKRQEKVYRKMTGIGYKWLKEEIPWEEVMNRLTKEYLPQKVVVQVIEKTVTPIEPATAFAERVLENVLGSNEQESYTNPVSGIPGQCLPYPVAGGLPVRRAVYRYEEERVDKLEEIV
ncbi:MAG: hypothetical protein Q8941_10455, partial [Bacteroidota bacterium]|nr:hypothetical protein [Bacteroidota bacterium]